MSLAPRILPRPGPAARTQSSVLVVSYACPPIHVQMSPVMARLVAGLNTLGYAVDVICADPGVWYLPREDSLVDYVTAHCRRVQRLVPRRSVLRSLAHRFRRLRDLPDCMEKLQDAAVAAVLAAGPLSYAGVITVSPFHSVNPVMVRVKRAYPDLTWIAHFCDPWAANPLEPRWDVRRVSAWREPQTLRAATYVTHSSRHALEMVLEAYPFVSPERTRVIPHVFDSALYPSRPKCRNDKLTLRSLGTLFGRRTPQPLFLALGRLLERRPDLRETLRLELIGLVEPEMLESPAALALPAGMVQHRETVSFGESLALMYDADILLVIEADVVGTPFVPSKVTDYMGADTPIVGIAPAGGCREILDRLGCPTAAPDDIAGIAAGLEAVIDAAHQGRGAAWCDDAFRRSFDLVSGASAFASLLRSSHP